MAQHAKLVLPPRRNKAELAGNQQLAGSTAGDNAATFLHVAILGLRMTMQRSEVPLRAGAMEKGHIGQPDKKPTTTIREQTAPCKWLFRRQNGQKKQATRGWPVWFSAQRRLSV